MKIIQRSDEHLLDLIDDFLDISKIKAGLVLLNKKSFDLYRLLDNNEELDSYLVFEVSDTGRGIALEEIETLFDDFVQTSSGERQ